MIEAVFVGIIGGLIGVGVGVGLATAIAQFGGFTTVITIEPIIISFMFSVGISLFFGIYPAKSCQVGLLKHFVMNKFIDNLNKGE